MKNRFLREKLCILLISLALILWAPGFLWAAEADANGLDVAIKISNVHEKLNLIDSLMPSDPNGPEISLVAKLRGMLMGTEWLDPSRSVVLGMVMAEPKPEIAILLPYQSPKPEFQTATHAAAGPDYYVIPLPAGSPREGASGPMLKDLLSASNTRSDDFLSIDIAVRTLLEKGDQKIRDAVEKLGTSPGKKGEGNLYASPQDVKEIVKGLVKTGRQLETLTESIDVTDETLIVSLNLSAAENSPLSNLFVRGPMMTYFNTYLPNEQINFRSVRYDNQGYMRLFGDIFGKIYERAGIDFSAITQIMNHFTGEMAGGMTFYPGGIDIEMISVLDEKSKGDDFVEKIYLPWLETYIKNITGAARSRTGQVIEDAFSRTPDTTLEDQKVLGVEINFPYGVQGVKQEAGGNCFPMKCEWQTWTDFFIIAPNDKRMRALINTAKNLKEEVYMGSLFKMDMNLGAYLDAVVSMAGGSMDETGLPKMGKMYFVADAEEGQLSTSSTIRISDVRELVKYAKQMTPLKKTPRKAIPAVFTETR